MTFTVVPPVYQQLWFQNLMVALLGAIGFQTVRVVRRDRRLQASNHDLTVEAALERVRAKALGMQKGGDLRSVSYALFDELRQLEIPYQGLEIYDETRDVIEIWRRGADRDSRTNEMATRAEIAIRKGLPTRWAPLEAVQEVNSHLKARIDEYIESIRNHIHLFNVPGGAIQQDRWHSAEQAMRDHRPESWTDHFVFNTYGALRLLATESLTDQEIEIAKRFSDLFAFAYSRFLDIEEREKRNRELEVENALELVRAQALGMQKSEELSKVSEILFEQYEVLGFSPFR